MRPWYLLALLLTACFDTPITAPLDEAAAHFGGAEARATTLILTNDSGPDDGAVWIAQADTGVLGPRSGDDEIRARLWTVLDSAPTDSGLTLRISRRRRALRYDLSQNGAPLAWGGGGYSPGRLQGPPRARGRGRAIWHGVNVPIHFAVLGDLPMPAEPVVDAPWSDGPTTGTGGIVSLRIDDCVASDAATFEVLHSLHLVAEFGVVSRAVDEPRRCTSKMLRAVLADGGTVESHSRYHQRSPADFAQFYIETVGSARDLRALGFTPHVFIQPGSWNQGPFDLDSRAKMDSPAGRLLRRVYVATEAYAYPDTVIVLPALGRIGPTALILRTLTPEQIAAHVRAAAAGGRWIEFMWHSFDISADSLRPRLAVIAALRDSGLVQVLPFYRGLHAVQARLGDAGY